MRIVFGVELFTSGLVLVYRTPLLYDTAGALVKKLRITSISPTIQIIAINLFIKYSVNT